MVGNGKATVVNSGCLFRIQLSIPPTKQIHFHAGLNDAFPYFSGLEPFGLSFVVAMSMSNNNDVIKIELLTSIRLYIAILYNTVHCTCFIHIKHYKTKILNSK